MIIDILYVVRVSKQIFNVFEYIYKQNSNIHHIEIYLHKISVCILDVKQVNIIKWVLLIILSSSMYSLPNFESIYYFMHWGHDSKETI